MFRACRPFKLEGRHIRRGELLDDVPAHLEGTFLRVKFIERYEPRVDLAKLTKPRLLALADELGVEVPAGSRVADIRELLKVEVQ